MKQSSELMTAMVLDRIGGVEHLRLATVPRPVPADDEVLIRVATVAVNRQDINLIHGRFSVGDLTMPHIPGLDPAGVVEAVGAGVTSSRVGDRVVVKPPIACDHCAACAAGEDDACERIRSVGVHRPGGMADYVVVPQRNVFAIPDRLGFPEATAVAHSFPVALTLLRKVVPSASGTVLVSGAAGAVGSATVQLARIFGAHVIAAVGSERGAAWLHGLPADVSPHLVIDYRAEPEFAGLVRKVDPAGADVYVETASEPAVWDEALSTLARRARVAVIGAHAGPIVEVDNNWLFRQRVSIIGCSGSSLAAFAEAIRLAGAGRIMPDIDSIVPLREAADAYRRLMSRGNRGKIVLRVSDDIE